MTIWTRRHLTKTALSLVVLGLGLFRQGKTVAHAQESGGSGCYPSPGCGCGCGCSSYYENCFYSC